MENLWLDQLKLIQEKKYEIKNTDIKDIINKTLPLIGDQDAKVRDDLVYPVLAHLFHDQHLKEDELEHYLDLFMSDDYLFFDMENKKPYSVLKRSFTILQLVILCYVHRRDHVISHIKINHLLERMLVYYANEQIVTGYDPLVGWVHTVAHSADLFHQLVQLEHLNASDILRIFQAIQIKMMNEKQDYLCNEDERSVVVIKKALELERLSLDDALSWIDGFIIKDKTKIYLDLMILENNIKRFLRSLYFSLYKDEKYHALVKRIEFVLTENQKR